jgi:uncharacterized protein YjiS (DUF1127 family)
MDTRKRELHTNPDTWFARLLALCGHWKQRRMERAEIRRLDDRDLRDIGITRVDAMRESDKPFWRP